MTIKNSYKNIYKYASIKLCNQSTNGYQSGTKTIKKSKWYLQHIYMVVKYMYTQNKV